MKRLALLTLLAFGIASSVSADIMWPECWPCASISATPSQR